MPSTHAFEFWIMLILVAFVAGFFWAFGGYVFSKVAAR